MFTVRNRRVQSGRQREARQKMLGEAPNSKTHQLFDDPQGQSSSSFRQRSAALTQTKAGLPWEDATSVTTRTKRSLFRSGAEQLLFRACLFSGTFCDKLTDWVTQTTSKPLPLQKPVVHIKFRNALWERRGHPVLTGKKWKRPSSLRLRQFQRGRMGARSTPSPPGYPELVGKRIRHLYEEKDKTKDWYWGVVLRVHKDPLKIVYEVKYDNELEWHYYLKILQDYKKGWLEMDE